IEEVADETVQAARLLGDRLEKLASHGSASVFAREERGRGPGDRRERRPEVVRDGGQKRVAKLLALGAALGVVRLLGEARAFQRDRGLPAERGEEDALLGRLHLPALGGLQAHDAERLRARGEREVERLGARKRRGAHARGLLVVEGVARRAELRL